MIKHPPVLMYSCVQVEGRGVTHHVYYLHLLKQISLFMFLAAFLSHGTICRNFVFIQIRYVRQKQFFFFFFLYFCFFFFLFFCHDIRFFYFKLFSSTKVYMLVKYFTYKKILSSVAQGIRYRELVWCYCYCYWY